MKYPKNFGIDIKVKRPTDYVIGASGLSEEIINSSGDWTKYLPVKEYQKFSWGDSMQCVTMSALNCLEILHKFKYKKELNWSDRFTAKMSNTTHKGNWLTTVGDSIRHDGLILEEDYTNEANSWNDYYKEILQESKDKGISFLQNYKINYEWIVPTDADGLEHALKIAPIQVVVHAWENSVNGIYKKTSLPLNHAVTLINSVHGEYRDVFDHYDSTTKRLSWDYIIQHGFKYSITKNKMEFIKEKNKSAVYLVKGKEIIPINDGLDFLNLQLDWSEVITVDNLDGYTIVDKKLYTFIR